MSYAASGPVQLAGVAQKMVNILFFNCPADYACGGPAYAAQSGLDTILHQMGIGVAILQHKGANTGMGEYEKHLRKMSITGPSIMSAFIQHKSHILGAALQSVMASNRDQTFRENPEVTREALLMLLQYYFDKSGDSKEDFWKKLLENSHDELIQLEKDAA